MSGLDTLYQELILDHAKRRVGFGLADEDGTYGDSHEKNPVCGDEITLRVRLSGDSIRDVTWEGEGCSISRASASMLTTLIDEAGSMSRDEASALIEKFRGALRSRGKVPVDEDTFGDAASLSGVAKYSSRVKCAMLAWVALENALAQADTPTA